MELPEISGRLEERQQEVYEEIRTEIEYGLEEIGLELPVYEGFLHRPAGSGNGE